MVLIRVRFLEVFPTHEPATVAELYPRPEAHPADGTEAQNS